MAHVRGLHDTGGFRKLRIVGSGDERNKLTAELSRLDHQRALVERQLAVWTKKQQVTKYRLELLDKEITKLGRLFGEFVRARHAGKQRKRTPATKPGQQPDSNAATVPRHDVSLEY